MYNVHKYFDLQISTKHKNERFHHESNFQMFLVKKFSQQMWHTVQKTVHNQICVVTSPLNSPLYIFHILLGDCALYKKFQCARECQQNALV